MEGNQLFAEIPGLDEWHDAHNAPLTDEEIDAISERQQALHDAELEIVESLYRVAEGRLA